jgi:chromosomal replication initiator protein
MATGCSGLAARKVIVDSTSNRPLVGGGVGTEFGSRRTSTDSLARAQKLWQATLGELQLQINRGTFDTWLRGSRVIAYENDTLAVHVRHTYAVDWLENRLLPVIERALQRHAGPQAKVEFTARAPQQEDTYVLVPETVPDDDAGLGTGRPSKTNGRPSTTLNPCYTFDTFVVGAGNRLAHAASMAVAESPAYAYNPLFLYGGVGLGKTHLLHALGHEAQRRGLSILYVSSEWFTNDLINAIRSQKTEEFRAKYRTNDILLVDDIQFIVGKERTQEEFFHTFNTLHGAGRQIVVSCDRPPKALVALEDRLSSRFSWGLIADVQPPDFETRIAILKAKAEGSPVQVPDAVLTFIARKIPSNIRELEGALNRVLAHARLVDAPLAMETVQVILANILGHVADLSPEQILSTVAQHFSLSKEELIGRSRRRAVSQPRQLCMFLIREETGTSLPQIGQLLGGRDHTTILHGCEKIAGQIEADDQVRRDWLAIKEKLTEGARP